MPTDIRLEDPTNPLSRVENELANLIDVLIHLGVQVHDYTGTKEAQVGLNNNINVLVNQLRELSNHPELSDILITPEIVAYIEDGRNPDVYTREFVEIVRKINQHLNGKSKAYTDLRDTLAEKIVKEFPEMKMAVEEIQERTSG